MRIILLLSLTLTSFAQTPQTPNILAALEQFLAPNLHPNTISATAQVTSFTAPGFSGTATLISNRDGSGSVVLNLTDGTKGRSVAPNSCTFTDAKGQHSMAGHNCVQEQIWEIPLFIVVPERGMYTYDGSTNGISQANWGCHMIPTILTSSTRP